MMTTDTEQATYGWVIDHDEIADATAAPGSFCNAVGLMGPRDIPDEIAEQLRAGAGRCFRIFDDDGELYYRGRIIGDEIGKGADIGEQGFAPLWDFAEGNAGATEIRFYFTEAHGYALGTGWQLL